MPEDESPPPSDSECMEGDVFAQVYSDSDGDGMYESVCEVELREELATLEVHKRVLRQMADRVKRIQNDIELRQESAQDSRNKILVLRQEVMLQSTSVA